MFVFHGILSAVKLYLMGATLIDKVGIVFGLISN